MVVADRVGEVFCLITLISTRVPLIILLNFFVTIDSEIMQDNLCTGYDF